mgnify:FL=1|tara:strand:+ start:5167 stop:5724 length:558 start_codon:yes stop_codon:yes gene_type:complete
MKRDIVLFGSIGFLIWDVYNDGKYSKKVKEYKKHFKIITILFFALSLHLFTKKHPNQSYSTVSHMNGMIRHLPINKDSADLLTPVLNYATNKSDEISGTNLSPQEKRMLNSGTANTTNGRSVSGTKKKYIAAQQNWRCGHCDTQLDAWFEVDHKIRLEHGGSNHVTNLVALCRNCHGKKTTLETL